MPNHPGHKAGCRPARKRTTAGIAILAAAAVSLLAAFGLHAQTPAHMQPAPPETAKTVAVSLYFADSARFALLAEQRQLARPENPVALGRAIFRELAAGPQNKRLMRALPEGNVLRTFFIAADKTAYVDLDEAMWTRHPGGVQADMLALYSIVNSLVLNMAQIDAVKILSLGRKPAPATGHLDLRYPFKANILLVR